MIFVESAGDRGIKKAQNRSECARNAVSFSREFRLPIESHLSVPVIFDNFSDSADRFLRDLP